MALPPLAIRGDLGVLSTAALRYTPSLLKSFIEMGPKGALGATKLLRPFSEIIDSLELKDPFIRNWVDLLAFLLAGVKSNAILSAEMVTILNLISILLLQVFSIYLSLSKCMLGVGSLVLVATFYFIFSLLFLFFFFFK